MNINYEYMQDSDFLFKIDCLQTKTQYIKIITLDWNERPIQEIQGITTGGSINLDGKSAMRRTCNLSMFISNEQLANVTNIDNLFSLNKKVYLEIGFKNTTNQYTQYPIIWMPLGTFVIINPSLSHSSGGVSLSLQLKDKMCLLNGECGGVIPASTQFDEYETIDEHGQYVIDRPVILQIISEVVNHFGGEQLGKIIISDVDTKVKQTMKWVGSTPLYFLNTTGEFKFTTNYSEVDGKSYNTYEYGQDVGFIYTDFTYPGELIGDAGSNVVTILDKIKNTLGNYEYFYDVYGNFIWQEIKNYLNTTHATVELEKLSNESYIADMSKGKKAFDFKDSRLITSYSNSPQFNKIKNDFVVWGIRKTAIGNTVPVRYHLAIDKKPAVGNIYKCFFYIDPEDGLEKAKSPISYSNRSWFPAQGDETSFYLAEDSGIIYKWDSRNMTYVALSGEQVQEYASKDDFPETGEINIIYVDRATSRQYTWDIDSKSEKYQQVQTQKADLIAANKTQIENLTNEIKALDTEINEFNKLVKEDSKLMEEAQKAQEELTEQYQRDAVQHDQNLSNYENERIRLMNLKDALTRKLIELNQSVDWEDPIGQYGKGNIDLYNRPQIENADGSISTVLSLGFYDEQKQKEVLIPCVTSEGILTEDEAISYYYSTGEYLGYFDTVEESNRYALELHTQQEILYSRLEIEGQTVTLLDLKITIIPNQSALVEKLNLQEQSSGQQMVETRALLNEAMEAYQNAAESYANNVQQVDQLNQQKEIKLQDIKTIQENEKAQIEILNASLYSYLPVIAAGMVNVQTTDWRSELYLQGVQAEPLGIKSNYYYTELEYEWPKHYDLKKNSYTNGEGEIVYTGGFRDEYERDPSTMDYYLDFIDSDSAIGYLSVNNIGRRTHVVNSKDVNCLFECHIPDLILIESGAEDTQARINECRARGQEYILVDTAIYHMLSMGGSQRSAFVEIKDLLYEMTAYNESVSINTLPIYHLEPNIRIGINNPEINISGDYMINSISLPLDTNGTSSISAVRPITKM